MGLQRVLLHECAGQVAGSLYSAKAMPIEAIDRLPSAAVWLEVDGDVPIDRQDWSGVSAVVVGGESVTLPKGHRVLARCRIPTNRPLCLTTESAATIALHAGHHPVHRVRHVGYGCWRSPLPHRSDLIAAASLGVRTVVDLTQRDRPDVRRWAKSCGLYYKKHPVDYDADVSDAVASCDGIGPFLVHCFHGRDRTGRFARLWLEAQC